MAPISLSIDCTYACRTSLRRDGGPTSPSAEDRTPRRTSLDTWKSTPFARVVRLNGPCAGGHLVLTPTAQAAGLRGRRARLAAVLCGSNGRGHQRLWISTYRAG